jgi:hypothetical protein
MSISLLLESVDDLHLYKWVVSYGYHGGAPASTLISQRTDAVEYIYKNIQEEKSDKEFLSSVWMAMNSIS